MQVQEKYAVLAFVAVIASVYFLAFAILVRGVLRYFGIGKVRDGTYQVWYRRIVLALAAIGALCILYGRFIEPYWLAVRTSTVTSRKLPPGTHSIRVVQISDLHSDPEARLEDELPSAIAALKPDLITFTGDALNSPEGLPVFRKCITEIAAIAPTFVVRGNWDVWFWYNQNIFGETGVTELDAGSALIDVRGVPVRISGIPVGKERLIPEVLSETKQEELSIFLYHYPDEIENPTLRSADIYLAGHTHGGQVALPFYGALLTLSRFGKKYEAGTYKVGQTTLNVNRGIGMEGGHAPRVRFYARPEVTVIDIVPEQK